MSDGSEYRRRPAIRETGGGPKKRVEPFRDAAVDHGAVAGEPPEERTVELLIKTLIVTLSLLALSPLIAKFIFGNVESKTPEEGPQ